MRSNAFMWLFSSYVIVCEGSPTAPYCLPSCPTCMTRHWRHRQREGIPYPSIPSAWNTAQLDAVLLYNCAGTNMAALVVAMLYSAPYHKPAGVPAWPRAVSLPFLVTMLQVSRGGNGTLRLERWCIKCLAVC